MSPIAGILFAPWTLIPWLICSLPLRLESGWLNTRMTYLTRWLSDDELSPTYSTNPWTTSLSTYCLCLAPPQSCSTPRVSPRPCIAPPGIPPRRSATSTSPLPPSQRLCLGNKSPARKKDIHLPIPPSNPPANANASETYRQHRPATALKICAQKATVHQQPSNLFSLSSTTRS